MHNRGKDQFTSLDDGFSMSTLVMFAHVFNDAQLSESILQGSHQKETIAFMSDMIRRIGRKYKKNDTEFYNTLKKIDKIFRSIKSDFILTDNNELVNELYTKKFLLLPGGWVGNDVVFGHSMLYEFTIENGSLYFTVYNTGAGVDNHENTVIKYKKQYKPTMRCVISLEVSKRDLAAFIFNLKKPLISTTISPKKSAKMYYDKDELYSNILSSIFLLGAKLIPNENSTPFIDPQLSGICSFEILRALLKCKMSGEEYIKFDLAFREIFLEKMLEYQASHAIFEIPKVREQVRYAIKNHAKFIKDSGLVESLYDKKLIDNINQEIGKNVSDEVNSNWDVSDSDSWGNSNSWEVDGENSEVISEKSLVRTNYPALELHKLTYSAQFEIPKNQRVFPDYKENKIPKKDKPIDIQFNSHNNMEDLINEIDKLVNILDKSDDAHFNLQSFVYSFEKLLISIDYINPFSFKKINNNSDKFKIINKALMDFYSILLFYAKSFLHGESKRPDARQITILNLATSFLLKICDVFSDPVIAYQFKQVYKQTFDTIDVYSKSLYSATYDPVLDAKAKECELYREKISNVQLNDYDDKYNDELGNEKKVVLLKHLFHLSLDKVNISRMNQYLKECVNQGFSTGVERLIAKDYNIKKIVDAALYFIIYFNSKIRPDEFAPYFLDDIQQRMDVHLLAAEFFCASRAIMDIVTKVLDNELSKLLGMSVKHNLSSLFHNYNLRVTDGMSYASTREYLMFTEEYYINELALNIFDEYSKPSNPGVVASLTLSQQPNTNQIQVNFSSGGQKLTEENAQTQALLHAAINSDAKMPALYDLFVKNLYYLDDKDLQLYFTLNLFQQGYLSLHIKRDPNILHKLVQMIYDGYRYSLRDKKVNETTCFFIEVSILLLMYSQSSMKAQDADTLNNILSTISIHLKEPSHQDSNQGVSARLHACQILVLTNLSQTRELNKDEIANLISSMVYSKIYEEKAKLHPAFVKLINHNIYLNSLWLINKLSADQIQVVLEKLTKFIPEKNLNWEFEYPFIKEKNNKYLIDISSGYLLIGNCEVRMLPKLFYSGNSLLAEKFGDHPIIATVSAHMASAEFDFHGIHYRCLSDSRSLEMQMRINSKDQWYVLDHDLSSLSFLPFTLLDANRSIWYSRENESFNILITSNHLNGRDYFYSSDSKILEIDKSGNFTGYQLMVMRENVNNGIISNFKESGRYLINEKNNDEFDISSYYYHVLNFEDPRFVECLYKKTDTQMLSIISLPRYEIELVCTVDLNNKPVFVLKDKPHYQLMINTDNCIAGFPHSLQFIDTRLPVTSQQQIHVYIPVQQFFAVKLSGQLQYWEIEFDRKNLINKYDAAVKKGSIVAKADALNLTISKINNEHYTHSEKFKEYELLASGEWVASNVADKIYLAYIYMAMHQFKQAHLLLNDSSLEEALNNNHEAIIILKHIIFDMPNVLGDMTVKQSLEYKSAEAVAVRMKAAALLCKSKYSNNISKGELNELIVLCNRYLCVIDYIPEPLQLSFYEEINVLREICLTQDIKSTPIGEILTRWQDLEQELLHKERKRSQLSIFNTNKPIKIDEDPERKSKYKSTNFRENIVDDSLKKEKKYLYSINKQFNGAGKYFLPTPRAELLPKYNKDEEFNLSNMQNLDLNHNENKIIELFYGFCNYVLDKNNDSTQLISFVEKYILSYVCSPFMALPVFDDKDKMINACLAIIYIYNNREQALKFKNAKIDKASSYEKNDIRNGEWVDRYIKESKIDNYINIDFNAIREEKVAMTFQYSKIDLLESQQMEKSEADNDSHVKLFDVMPDELKPYIKEQLALENFKQYVHKQVMKDIVDERVSKDNVFINNMILHDKRDYECGKRLNEINNQIKLNSIKHLSDPIVRDNIKNNVSLAINKIPKNKESIKSLLKYANKLPEDQIERNKYNLHHTAIERQDIDFDELLYLYLMNNMSLFKKKTGLNDDEISILIKKIHRYLLDQTFKSQAKRVLKLLDKVDTFEFASARKDQALAELGKSITSLQHPDVMQSNILLLFECMSNKTIYPDQIASLQKMLHTDKGKFVSQVIKMFMGGGKTTVIDPLALVMKAMSNATGNNLSVIVFLSALLKMNAADLLAIAREYFNLNGYIFLFDRDSDLNPKTLKKQLKRFIAMMQNHEFLITTPESLQSLELKYLELLFTSKQPFADDVKKQMKYLAHILKLFKSHADAIFDEGHEGLKIHNELNYILGIGVDYKKEYLAFIVDLYEFLSIVNIAKSPVNVTLLDILKGNHVYPDNKDAQEIIKQKLINAILYFDTSPIKQILDKHPKKEDLIKAFLMNVSDQILLDLTREEREFLSLCKGQINAIMPLILSRQPNVHFGFPLSKLISQEEKDIAIPYSGNMNPKEKSKFGNFEETIGYTIRLHLMSDKFNSDFSERFMRHFSSKIKAEIEKSGYQLSIAETSAAKEFMQLTTIDINSIDLNMKGLYEFVANKLNAIDSPSLKRHIKLYSLEKIILPYIKKDNQIIRSDSINCAEQCNTVQLPSGTPSNFRTYHDSIAFDEDGETLGSDGQILDVLLKKNPPIYFTKSKSFKSIMEKIHNDPNLDRLRAFIDAGAIFEGVKNKKVAQEIARFLPDISHVLYFNEDNQLIAIDKKNHKIVLEKTDVDYIKSIIPTYPDKCFIYYDQAHTIGVDLRKMLGAHAIVTVSNVNTTDDIWQACMRMRDIFGSETVSFLLNENILKTHPNINNMQSLADMLQMKKINKIGEENLFAIIKKMRNCVRSELNDVLFMSSINGIDLTSHQIETLKSFYIFTETESFYQKYGMIEKKTNTVDYVNSIKDQIYGDFIKITSILNDLAADINLQHVLIKLNAIVDKVGSLCFDEIKAKFGEFDQTEVMSQKETQQELQLQLQIEVEKSNIRPAAVQFWFQYVPLDDKLSSVGSATKTNNPFTLIETGLSKYDSVRRKDPVFSTLEEKLSSSKVNKNFSFDANLMISSNATTSYVNQDELLGIYRKRSPFFVAAQKNGETYFLIIAEEEINFFVNYIESDSYKKVDPYLEHIWIESTNQSLVAGNKPAVNDKKYALMLEQLRFFNGDIRLLLDDKGQMQWLNDDAKDQKFRFLCENIMPKFPDKAHLLPMLSEDLGLTQVVVKQGKNQPGIVEKTQRISVFQSIQKEINKLIIELQSLSNTIENKKNPLVSFFSGDEKMKSYFENVIRILNELASETKFQQYQDKISDFSVAAINLYQNVPKDDQHKVKKILDYAAHFINEKANADFRQQFKV